MKLKALHLKCLRIRLIEEAISRLYPSDKIQSPVHLSNGQEAVSVGVCANLNKKDLVFGTYRGHALYLAKGGDLKKMMAELFGRRTGCGKGKAGSMHLADKNQGVMGCSAVVSSTIPLAVGAAYAAKLRGTEQVTVCFFGEGATGEGVYHESMNFAAKHSLPILFVCENNSWAIFTNFSQVHSYRMVEHAKSYGLSAKKIEEGWDVKAVDQAAKTEIEEIRKGNGPCWLEFTTFRYMQHVGPLSDIDQGHRSKEDLKAWQRKDSLCSIANDPRYHEAIQKIELEIEAAIAFADSSDYPKNEELLEDVY